MCLFFSVLLRTLFHAWNVQTPNFPFIGHHRWESSCSFFFSNIFLPWLFSNTPIIYSKQQADWIDQNKYLQISGRKSITLTQAENFIRRHALQTVDTFCFWSHPSDFIILFLKWNVSYPERHFLWDVCFCMSHKHFFGWGGVTSQTSYHGDKVLPAAVGSRPSWAPWWLGGDRHCDGSARTPRMGQTHTSMYVHTV